MENGFQINGNQCKKNVLFKEKDSKINTMLVKTSTNKDIIILRKKV